MRPRVVFAGLISVSAGLGLIAGWRVATLTETDVINAFAARHVALAQENGLPGASERDCIAFPVDWEGGRGWLAVRCGPSEQSVTYYVNRLGFLVGQDGQVSTQNR